MEKIIKINNIHIDDVLGVSNVSKNINASFKRSGIAS
jgi:hypothetical protein